MSEQKDPPRLIDDPELGPTLRAVRDEGLSAERLAANRAAIDARIASLPAGNPWLKTLAKLGGGVLVATGGLILFQSVLRPADEAPIVLPATPTPIVVDATPAPTPFAVSEAAKRPSRTAEPLETPAPVPVGGTLAEELRLFRAAEKSLRDGDGDAAIAALDELDRRFPKSELRLDAPLARAEALVMLLRDDDAQPLLEALVADPRHAGRRAELLRTLGDLHRRKGDCAKARDRYRAALDAGATGDEASASRFGIGACSVTND